MDKQSVICADNKNASVRTVVKLNDAEAIIQAIVDVYNSPSDAQMFYGKRDVYYIKQNHNINVLVDKRLWSIQ